MHENETVKQAQEQARSSARIRKHMMELVEMGLYDLPPYCPECGGGGEGCPKCKPQDQEQTNAE